MVDMMQRRPASRELLDRLDDHADWLVRKTRRYLPHAARFCLVSTFIEDGFRLLTQWSDQVDYIQSVWGIPVIFAAFFIFVNIVTQFVGSAFVLGRYRVKIGVAILMSTVLIQTVGYNIWTRVFFMRNLSLIGSLLLLLAEAQQETRSLLAGLPSAGENTLRQYILLGGRILIILMSLTLIHLGSSIFYIIQSIGNLILVLLVAIGYKTKLCATVLVIWLTGMNFYYNRFWAVNNDSLLWDFLKYDFFQTWSVIGGLGLVVAYGPGGVSVDDYKKKW
ncbi:Surfeit locus protein 4 [Schistosoma japonicum]|uniref:Surfeit locus protein 4 n=1 Tax=Schistosoma japonicum TaxID=6182 RepID=C1L6W8_SCHJA|nr:Surfeit locus protein 4 [Schistosoma japonicum]TNN07274.1 Surfeit locus protein 4 [Schistosoma japonicum]CAX70446.1 Surfeit locus protein 4 [Schistosoma japonicum]CAX70447.1 Surfeit locus protein 4 [Schistosoma japonicum]CAX70448.1 Surfeit locus protein 4 [Schistosoma japonicum]